ncbi:MAG: ribosome recycling factor [Candidatus Pacebacteria bacterium]|nr:ribosome recycling factor [Candidatus Paceibacterota bacterium]
MAYDFKQLDSKLTGTKEWLASEYQSLRTGRAAPALLDSVHVDAYGSRMPLKQVANVGVEDSRTLAVSPFDPGLLKDIERAITAANLGVGTSVNGQMIRISFPELTTERRGELVKAAKAKLEEARVAVRGIRNEISDDIEAKEKAGDMSEDEKFRYKEDMQKKVDAANQGLELLFKKKEDEMML